MQGGGNTNSAFRNNMMMGGLYMALMMGAAGLGTASAFSPPGPPATSARDRSASFPSIGNGASFFSAPLSSRPQIKRASTSSLNAAAAAASAAASVATNVNPLFSFLTLPASLTPLYAALSALAATIAGGLFSGSLHAVAGPDHLAALIPRCCGLRWHRAARVGAVWGCGHGVSATLLGVAGFAFKRQIMGGGGAVNQDLLEGASSVMEIAIGVSLVVIGLLGIKEAGEWKVDENVEGESGELAANSCDAVLSEANSANSAVPNPAKRAVLFNGLLHGFSWDGAPSLAPALAVATWRGSLAFLGAYAVGTALAMTVATAAIGELTFKAGRALDRPDLPRVLSRVSSSVAVLVGLVWVGLALR